MLGVNGLNISEWQLQQQEFQDKKSGFGLGYSDSIATIVDGMKWLFNFHEGAISAYSNIFESLLNGSSLTTLFGKSSNMFGIKFLESLGKYFSDKDNEVNMFYDNILSSNFDDYPYANNEIIKNSEGLSDMYDAVDYCDNHFSLQRYSQYFDNDKDFISF